MVKRVCEISLIHWSPISFLSQTFCFIMIFIKSFLNHSLIKHGTWWWMLSHHGFYHERHIRLHWRAKGQDQSLVSHAWSFHCFPQDFAVMVLYRLRNSKHRRVWGDHTHFSRFPYIKSPTFPPAKHRYQNCTHIVWAKLSWKYDKDALICDTYYFGIPR